MKRNANRLKYNIGDDFYEFFLDRGKLKINGMACRFEFDEDGFIHLHGPDAVWVQMRDHEDAWDRLRAVSLAIGVNVNTLDADALDQMLADCHSTIVQFVPDGTSLDVAPEEYEALVSEHNRFADSITGTESFKAAVKRSAIIRKHMMAAKIEERAARGLAKKSVAEN